MKPYRVLAVTENIPEQISGALREMGIGMIDFKARGVKVDLKTVHKRIRGRGKGKGLVVFTRLGEKEKAVICRYA